MDSSGGDISLSTAHSDSYIMQPSPSRTSTISTTPSTSQTTGSYTRSRPFPSVILEQKVLRNLRRWALCFCVVEFDLDKGPDLDNVYPLTYFSSSMRANIAFSSLPEGDLPTAGAHCYSWRIPITKDGIDGIGAVQGAEKRDGLEQVKEGDWLYGYVYFVMEKDEKLRRGYSQRSLVLVSHVPNLTGLFTSVIATLGPLHFKHAGGGMVESSCYNIASWPEPTPGLNELPLLGTIQSVEIPLPGQVQWTSAPVAIAPGLPSLTTIPASLPPTPLSTTLHDMLSFSKILLLWELVLLGDPLLIFSADPRTGSELVNNLVNLIRPIMFGGDYRPYFHIHDSDFGRIARPEKAPPSTIVSFTNPLILQTCKHWPHLLRTHSQGDQPPGLTSTRKRHVKKDPVVAKELDKAFSKGDYTTCDGIIFRHLSMLTEQFLAPLNRYFGTLPSTDESLHTPRHSRSFQPSQFLLSLKSHGTSLTLRSNQSKSNFYQKFLTSPNFASWLHARSDATGEEVRRRYLERLEKANLGDWAEGKTEAEMDELVKRMEAEASISENKATPSSPRPPSPEAERNKRRTATLRTQAARLRSLKDERSGGSGLDSDSDVGR